MATYWIASGAVRGDCTHKHRTMEGARACVERDRRDVVRGHGGTAYSDRTVVRVEVSSEGGTDGEES